MLDLARLLSRLRGFGLAALLAAPVACSSTPDAATGSDDIVELPHTDVKNQAIGNCWLYATASWTEALHAAATEEKLDLSESYWSYWHWYLQVLWSADPSPDNAFGNLEQVNTGGGFAMAAHILKYMGAMKEGDFIPEDEGARTSRRQSSAQAAINKSLREGALKDRAARADMDLLRKEMDAAWGLSPEVSARLDAAFGRNLEKSPDAASTEETKVIPSSKLLVAVRDPATKEKVNVPLADILPSAIEGIPGGRFAWQEVAYPTTPTERRAFMKRMQRALHDGMPPLLTFLVDFAALRGSKFADVPASPGRQGGHMVAVSDYQAENVPGFGTLLAGKLESRPEALDAALADEVQIPFIRVKNSWGPTGGGDELSVSGHYDLYMKYLDGPASFCLDANGETNRDNCRPETPFTSLVLPAGY
ncbi:MAG: hypothetical protein KC657_26300 [Myxococcales bacterium]|nr:hypothetical protein [Myxococcales bacterium]